MAFHLSNRIIFLLEFLLIVELYLSSSTHATPLEEVCQQAKDRAFCLNTLGSDPRTKTATLSLLGQIAIDMARTNGTAAKTKVHSLMVIAVDPQLKTLLSQCENSYDDALSALRNAPDDLNQGRYRDLFLHAGQAFDAVERCESSFKRPAKSPIEFENRKFKGFCSIIGIIANDLNSGKLGNLDGESRV